MTESGARLDRVSIPYHVPTTGIEYDQIQHYPWMFVQDVAEHLFPSGGDVGRQAVFRLSPEDQHVSKMIESAFVPFGRYGGHGRGMSSMLSNFGNRAAGRLLESGSATCEVAPIVNANGQAISFSVFQVAGARSFAGITWQTIPKNALTGARWEEPKPVNRRLVRIPRKRVIRMRLPREYRRISSGLRALRHVGSALPDFAIQNLNPDASTGVPYDLEELTGIERRAVATITRSTGWNARASFADAVTGYYTTIRFLRFEEFKARLRDTVEDTTNRILAVAGAAAGFTGVVSLHGLPTLEEIAASRDDLAAGRLDFAKTIEQYSVYGRGRASSRS